jgi:hypothetical protein
MSLRYRTPAIVSGPVLATLKEMRYATPNQIAARLDRFTLKQVQKALSNMARKGIVCNSGATRVEGISGAAPSTYWMAGDEAPADLIAEPIKERELTDRELWRRKRERHGPRYASVWHYAQGVAVQSRRVSSVWDLGSAHGISTRESA